MEEMQRDQEKKVEEALEFCFDLILFMCRLWFAVNVDESDSDDFDEDMAGVF